MLNRGWNRGETLDRKTRFWNFRQMVIEVVLYYNISVYRKSLRFGGIKVFRSEGWLHPSQSQFKALVSRLDPLGHDFVVGSTLMNFWLEIQLYQLALLSSFPHITFARTMEEIQELQNQSASLKSLQNWQVQQIAQISYQNATRHGQKQRGILEDAAS